MSERIILVTGAKGDLRLRDAVGRRIHEDVMTLGPALHFGESQFSSGDLVLSDDPFSLLTHGRRRR